MDGHRSNLEHRTRLIGLLARSLLLPRVDNCDENFFIITFAPAEG